MVGKPMTGVIGNKPMADRTGDPIDDVPKRPPAEHCMARRSRDGRFRGYCQQPSGWGTNRDTGRCRFHGGSTPSGPDHGAWRHGLYSDALREEDVALLEKLEDLATAKKLEDTLNLQIVKLYRAVESLEGDADRQSFWDAFSELVANVDDPSTDDLRQLARMLGTNDKALREWMDLIRRTAKSLHDITEGQTVRHEHDVSPEQLDELQERLSEL